MRGHGSALFSFIEAAEILDLRVVLKWSVLPPTLNTAKPSEGTIARPVILGIALKAVPKSFLFYWITGPTEWIKTFRKTVCTHAGNIANKQQT